MPVLDLFGLFGKTALATGSSAGLGAAIALALAEAGADVICDGNSRPAEETCRKVQRKGRRAMAIRADLSGPSGADVGGAAVFLCSAASDYIHGHILAVDGGWMGR